MDSNQFNGCSHVQYITHDARNQWTVTSKLPLRNTRYNLCYSQKSPTQPCYCHVYNGTSPKQHARYPRRYGWRTRGLSALNRKHHNDVTLILVLSAAAVPSHPVSFACFITFFLHWPAVLSVCVTDQQRPSRGPTMQTTLRPGFTFTHCVPTTIWTSSSRASSVSMWSPCLSSITISLRWVFVLLMISERVLCVLHLNSSIGFSVSCSTWRRHWNTVTMFLPSSSLLRLYSSWWLLAFGDSSKTGIVANWSVRGQWRLTNNINNCKKLRIK